MVDIETLTVEDICGMDEEDVRNMVIEAESKEELKEVHDTLDLVERKIWQMKRECRAEISFRKENNRV